MFWLNPLIQRFAVVSLRVADAARKIFRACLQNYMDVIETMLPLPVRSTAVYELLC